MTGRTTPSRAHPVVMPRARWKRSTSSKLRPAPNSREPVPSTTAPMAMRRTRTSTRLRQRNRTNESNYATLRCHVVTYRQPAMRSAIETGTCMAPASRHRQRQHDRRRPALRSPATATGRGGADRSATQARGCIGPRHWPRPPHRRAAGRRTAALAGRAVHAHRRRGSQREVRRKPEPHLLAGRLDLFEHHRRLDAITTDEALAARRGGRNGVQSVTLRGLRVDGLFQLRQVAGAGAHELLLEDYLEHYIARSRRHDFSFGSPCPVPRTLGDTRLSTPRGLLRHIPAFLTPIAVCIECDESGPKNAKWREFRSTRRSSERVWPPRQIASDAREWPID